MKSAILNELSNVLEKSKIGFIYYLYLSKIVPDIEILVSDTIIR